VEKVSLLIKNAYLITMDKNRNIFQESGIAINDDKILAIGPTKDLEARFEGEKTIDAKDKFVFPGFVNTHSHLFQVLLKGLGRDKLLYDWLNSSVRRAIKNIDPEAAYYAALVGCIENIRSGCTTILDYQYCHGQLGIDDAVMKAFEDLGIRGILGRGHTKVSGFPPGCECEIDETEEMFFNDVERLAKKYADHPTIGVAISPAIVWDLSENGYYKVRELANQYKIPIAMHTVETEDDDEYCLKEHGMRLIPYLEKVGLLGPDYIAVHSVQMTPEDIDIFEKYDVKVSHNPVSNMILASGVAPVPEFLERGITVGLATDGAASNDTQDMMEVLKITALIHKLHTRNAAAISASQVLEMATLGGAKCVQMEEKIGSLEVGKQADLIIYNPKTAKSVPAADPVSTLVYSSGENNIETVVVAGKVLMENGSLTCIDEEEALDKLQEIAYKIREKSGLGNHQWGQKITVYPFSK
jgi:5-methylthioadenosine/S-adenosylhomocysteine deaminase